jgi:hypothetical protein
MVEQKKKPPANMPDGAGRGMGHEEEGKEQAEEEGRAAGGEAETEGKREEKSEEAGGNQQQQQVQDEEENGLTWLQRRYNALQRPIDADMGGESYVAAPEPLMDLMHGSPFETRLLECRDELRGLHSDGRLLHGWYEGPVCFPPTYRRLRNCHGDAYDYTDVARLKVHIHTHARDLIARFAACACMYTCISPSSACSRPSVPTAG